MLSKRKIPTVDFFLPCDTIRNMKKKNPIHRIRYEVDSLNRLVFRKYSAPDGSLGKKITLEGKFKLDKGNRLSYYLKSPKKLDDESPPLHKISFSGRWSLTPNHDLKFTLEESRTQVFGDTLLLKGNLLKADAKTLIFALRKRRTPRGLKRNLLKLKGTWRCDKRNRLIFLIEKRKASPDKLIFQGAWEVDKRNALIYRYERPEGGRNSLVVLGFKGFWQIDGKNRIGYLLEREGRSAFHFRVKLQTPNLRAKEGEIRYQVGIDLGAKKGKLTRDVVLFGKWRFNRDLSVSFQIQYRDGRRHAINFEAKRKWRKKNEIGLKLFSRKGEDLGMEVIFSRRFFKDARTFIRLSRDAREKAADFGMRIPF